MPRPPFFGEDTPKLVSYLKKISGWHRAKGVQLSLTTMAQCVRSEFPKSPPAPKQSAKRKGGGARRDEDPLRYILFKLCKKHDIWFGKTA